MSLLLEALSACEVRGKASAKWEERRCEGRWRQGSGRLCVTFKTFSFQSAEVTLQEVLSMQASEARNRRR